MWIISFIYYYFFVRFIFFTVLDSLQWKKMGKKKWNWQTAKTFAIYFCFFFVSFSILFSTFLSLYPLEILSRIKFRYIYGRLLYCYFIEVCFSFQKLNWTEPPKGERTTIYARQFYWKCAYDFEWQNSMHSNCRDLVVDGQQFSVAFRLWTLFCISIEIPDQNLLHSEITSCSIVSHFFECDFFLRERERGGGERNMQAKKYDE